ncbi:MAG: hypothetical protein RIS26_365 [Actinomycetota bacterium]|jgi:hypothetical protein
MSIFKKLLAAALSVGLLLVANPASADDTYDVQIIKGSNINLVSQASRVPILIRNNYDTEVRVLIHVSPSNLRVRLPQTTSVTIAPNSTINATVPVQAVANGDVQLYVWLTSFSGVRLGQDEVINMQVIGNAEAIALGTMGVIVFGLLVVGSLRMIRRRKSAA